MGDKHQVIRQAEMLPVWVAKVLFKSRLRGAIVFVDTDSARYALIKRVLSGALIIKAFGRLCDDGRKAWIVPVNREGFVTS